MKTITLGLNELGQICINQFGNVGQLYDLKCFEATDGLMKLLNPGTTNPDDLRLNEMRLRHLYEKTPSVIHIVEKVKKPFDEAV